MTQSTLTKHDGLEIAQFLRAAIKREWVAQGHHLSGKFEESLKEEVIEMTSGIIIEGYAAGYAKYVENYLPAGKVPFTLGSGAGHSRFIDALIGYVRARGMASSEKECKSIAFAIAMTMKREGRSTRGSYAFSQTGKRHEFLEEALQGKVTQDFIRQYIDRVILHSVDNLIRKIA
jgi:hypothetical protein